MDCDKFTKLYMINDIRNYFMRLVKNTKNDNIKFFTNIELGEDKDNPHLHIQVWHDNQEQINRIYDKVISKFGLFSEFCHVTLPKEPKDIYDYVIKDYSKDKSDDELLALDDIKRVYRGVLEKKIRFSSHSKGKYTKAIYKSLYAKFDLKKDIVDLMLDNSIIDIKGNVNSRVIKFVYLVLEIMQLLRQYITSSKEIECYQCECVEFYKLFEFQYWIFGKLWNNSTSKSKKNVLLHSFCICFGFATSEIEA